MMKKRKMFISIITCFILMGLSDYSNATIDDWKRLICNNGDQTPPKPPKPPTPDGAPAGNAGFPVTLPVDPNEIIGPNGWMAIAEGDTVRWVNASQSLPYTIYFENDPERATAAAQVVTVRLKLHPLMNMADFGIGTFGFGNHVFPVEGAPLQYQTRLDLVEEMNLYVDVVAGIDITTNEAFWIFSSIDPVTGVAPTESDRGFLAVNDSTHIGEGFVTFTIKPKAIQCHTGDSIVAQASIVFDINDPIMTNMWVNTIDAVAPTSSMTVVQETEDSIYVAFNGNDDATGIAAYRLYYTAGQSAYRLAGRYPAGDTAVIATEPNTRYTFFSLGEDNVGNIEPMKDGPDTLFGNTNVQLLATVTPINAATIDGTGTYAQGDTATLTLHTAEGYRLLRWIEAGIPQGADTLLSLVADANHSLVAELERVSYPLTVEAAEGTTITASSSNSPIYQEVRHFDTLDIHIEASPCYGEVLFSLNNNPLTADTTIVVHEAITITSTATQQVDTGYLFDTVCRYTAYTANGFNILSSATGASGTFNFQLPTLNLNGCDSIARLSLFVKPSHTLTFLANGGDGTMPTQQVCDGEESVLIGSTFTREGFFFAGWATSEDADTTQYADGGIITLTGDQTLYAVWSSDCVDRESNRMVTVCDSYMWNGEVQAESGDYMRTVSAVVPGGCDSIYRLHLTVKHSTENLYQIVSCQPYTWVDGQTYNIDTTRQLSMTNSVGCDSIVTLQLTIAEDYFSTESISACDSYVWHDVEYTTSVDDPTFTIHGNHGCDSTFTLNLTILQSNTGTETVTVCDSYTWIDGNVYVASNDTAQHTLTAANVFGCDSTVTLNLTINYSTVGTETVTACDTFYWHGTTYTSSTSTPTFTTTNSMGCDSIATLHLTVNHSTAGTETITACNSYVWHGTEYTESTTVPTYTTTNNVGCDSVATLHLTVIYCSTTEITACDSYTWRGATYTASGTYYDGNDTLLLTVNHSTVGTETITACDTFYWHGTTFTSSTSTPTYSTTNSVGCDSVATLHLTVNYSTAGTETVTVCDSFYWHGIAYTSSTNTPTYTTTNSVGCDSVATLHLTVNHSTAGTETVTACDTFYWHGTTYTSSTSTPSYTTTNSVGCDSVATLSLTVNYSTDTTVTDTVEGSYNWNGTIYTESGTYQWQGTTEAGCDSVVTLMLVVNEVGIELIDGNGVAVSVHPNPTSGWITVDAEDILSVEVFDQAGRKVASYKQTNQIDLGGLPTGGYLLRIHLLRGTAVQRVIRK